MTKQNKKPEVITTPVTIPETKPVIPEIIPEVSGSVNTTEEPPEDQLFGQELISDDRIAVVIPYAKEFAQGSELKFALASLERFLTEPHKIIIIGDTEEWFSDEVLVIPHERQSDNPQADVIEKLKLAIASDEVSEKFIWTNDDIYLISPVTLGDIEVLKVKGKLNPEKFNGIYRDNILRTINLLDSLPVELPSWDYATHTPVVFEKELLTDLFESIKELHTGGYLLSSVYFNCIYHDHIPIMLDWKTDNWLLPVASREPDEQKFDALIARKKFLNNTETGYSPFLIKKLKELFPDKSQYEK